MHNKGLGRFFAPDERDENFLLRAVTGTPSLESLPEYRYHSSPYVLDQGPEPKCVGFSSKTMLMNSPNRQTHPHPTAHELYVFAQRNDEWSGENYDGTSVRAGMKACVHYGKVTEYRWAFTLEDAVRWLLLNGPLVMGTDWYSGMSEPRWAKGAAWMAPEGLYEGGHAYCVIGANRVSRKVRVLNNWGKGWADNGRAWMTFEAFEALILARGEAACPTEKRAA